MRPSPPSFSKALTALLAVSFLAGGAAAADTDVFGTDLPGDTPVTDWLHADHAPAPWTGDLATGDSTTVQDDIFEKAADARDTTYEVGEVNVDLLRGLSYGWAKHATLEEMNDGDNTTSNRTGIEDDVEEAIVDYETRLLSYSNALVERFKDVQDRVQATDSLTMNDVLAPDLCPSDPDDELVPTITNHTINLYTGETFQHKSLVLEDQAPSTAGSCGGGSQDRTVTVLPDGLAGSGDMLRVTNSTGSTRTMIPGGALVNAFGDLTSVESNMPQYVGDVVDDVAANWTNTTTDIRDPVQALIDAEANHESSPYYEHLALRPYTASNTSTNFTYTFTVEYTGGTGQTVNGTGQLFLPGLDSSVTIDTGTSRTASGPIILVGDTSEGFGIDTIVHSGSTYTVTEITNKATGNTTSSVTIEPNQYHTDTTTDPDGQLQRITDVYNRLFGSVIGGGSGTDGIIGSMLAWAEANPVITAGALVVAGIVILA